MALWARLLKDQAQAAISDRERNSRKPHRNMRKFIAKEAAIIRQSMPPPFGCSRARKNGRETWPRPRKWVPATGAEPDNYWTAATRAECELLLGNLDAVVTNLAKARQMAGGDFAALASTRKQMSLLCAVLCVDPEILRSISAPCIINFAGHLIGRRFAAGKEELVALAIRRELDELSVGFGYGSLAAGADILFAEELLRRGAELHVTLPFDTEDFRAVSVAPAGADWLTRFELCLKAATSVQFSSTDRYMRDGILFAFGSRLAMGSAILRGRHLTAPLRQLVVYDGRPPVEAIIEGTANEVAVWRNLGLETTRIDPDTGVSETYLATPPFRQVKDELGRRSLKAMIFGDFKGFSKLKDEQLPVFASNIMETLAVAIDSFGASVVHRNTWGDGLFLWWTRCRQRRALPWRCKKSWPMFRSANWVCRRRWD